VQKIKDAPPLMDNQVPMADGKVYSFGPVGIGYSRRISAAVKAEDQATALEETLKMLYHSFSRNNPDISREAFEDNLLTPWNIPAVRKAVHLASGAPREGEATPA
jgi:hypothetical protein